MIAFANILTVAIALYALGGLLFAVPFVWRGVNRIDLVASASSWGFRLIILPGVVALWPLLARRWWRGQGPPREKSAHRCATNRESA